MHGAITIMDRMDPDCNTLFQIFRYLLNIENPVLNHILVNPVPDLNGSWHGFRAEILC